MNFWNKWLKGFVKIFLASPFFWNPLSVQTKCKKYFFSHKWLFVFCCELVPAFFFSLQEPPLTFDVAEFWFIADNILLYFQYAGGIGKHIKDIYLLHINCSQCGSNPRTYTYQVLPRLWFGPKITKIYALGTKNFMIFIVVKSLMTNSKISGCCIFYDHLS